MLWCCLSNQMDNWWNPSRYRDIESYSLLFKIVQIKMHGFLLKEAEFQKQFLSRIKALWGQRSLPFSQMYPKQVDQCLIDVRCSYIFVPWMNEVRKAPMLPALTSGPCIDISLPLEGDCGKVICGQKSLILPLIPWGKASPQLLDICFWEIWGI